MTLYYTSVPTNITYNCPVLSCTINCIASSSWTSTLSIHWRDINGNILNSTIATKHNGIAVASLKWNKNESGTTFYCVATNNYGTTSHVVNVVSIATPMTPVQTIPIINNKLRFRLLTNSCFQPMDKSIQNELIYSLSQVVLFKCQYCNTSLFISKSGCDSTSTTILILTVASSNVSRYLIDWWNTGPTILYNKTLHALDQECNVTVQNCQLNCSTVIQSPNVTDNPTTNPHVYQLILLVTGSCLATVLITLTVFFIVILIYQCFSRKAKKNIQ